MATPRATTPRAKPLGRNKATAAESIREECSHLNTGAHPLNIEVNPAANLPALSAAVEVAAYRIALEATSNVLKHARATHYVITLTCANIDEPTVDLSPAQANGTGANNYRNMLLLSIADDGVGIPADIRSGVGMQAMRERAEELGGQLIIQPAASGPGTIVRAALPLL